MYSYLSKIIQAFDFIKFYFKILEKYFIYLINIGNIKKTP